MTLLCPGKQVHQLLKTPLVENQVVYCRVHCTTILIYIFPYNKYSIVLPLEDYYSLKKDIFHISVIYQIHDKGKMFSRQIECDLFIIN